MKICSKCGKAYPKNKDNFHKRKDGYLLPLCKPCYRIRSKIYNGRRKEKAKIRRKEYYIESHKKIVIARRKYSRTARGVYNSIKVRIKRKGGIDLATKDEFIAWHESQEKVCHYCGILESQLPLIKRTIRVTSRMSIDRINPLKGYVIGNLALACFACNSTKSNLLSEIEMIEIAQKYMKPKWESQLKGKSC